MHAPRGSKDGGAQARRIDCCGYHGYPCLLRSAPSLSGDHALRCLPVRVAEKRRAAGIRRRLTGSGLRRRRWWRRPGGVAVSSRRQPARGAFAAARLEGRGGGGALRNRHPRSDSVALAVDKRCGAFLGSFGAASVGRPAEALLNPRGESGGARTRRKARVRTRGLLVCGARGRGRTVLCLSLSLSLSLQPPFWRCCCCFAGGRHGSDCCVISGRRQRFRGVSARQPEQRRRSRTHRGRAR